MIPGLQGDLANLYDDTAALVGSLITTDATYATGSNGLRAGNSSAFETFTIQVPIIPEPQSAILLLLGTVALLGLRRFQRG